LSARRRTSVHWWSIPAQADQRR